MVVILQSKREAGQGACVAVGYSLEWQHFKCCSGAIAAILSFAPATHECMCKAAVIVQVVLRCRGHGFCKFALREVGY